MRAVRLVNGSPDTTVEAADRGFVYGDGLFETLCVRAGRAPLWALHFARFRRGAARLGLPVPEEALFQQDFRTLLEQSDEKEGVLRLQWTAGPGGRGLARPRQPSPTRVSAFMPPPPYPPQHWRDGIALYLCQLRLGEQPALAGIKHCNRLEYVLARREWEQDHMPEGLLLDAGGRVVEGTVTNMFAVRDGCLYTPALTRCGVQGVMRETVLTACNGLGLPVDIGDYSLEFWLAADELFVTNSLIGIWPVRELSGRAFAVGPVTRRLQLTLQQDGVAWMPAATTTDTPDS
ncbi:MAG: aminodeoxychorismate lyase [Ectothiorhodospiraceae bacterium]|nr:aminodeoxychorismate lyase [Paracoccaceae bacterium]MCH8503715.1 aminodeoxychorismate lyase [Ectothiorhodospiraceae bacterium]